MKLSIIVPVYNLENYISTTLESLLSIRFSFDYEIVVINDGSVDESESVIRDYQQKYSQIALYTIENQGVSNVSVTSQFSGISVIQFSTIGA